MGAVRFKTVAEESGFHLLTELWTNITFSEGKRYAVAGQVGHVAWVKGTSIIDEPHRSMSAKPFLISALNFLFHDVLQVHSIFLCLDFPHQR